MANFALPSVRVNESLRFPPQAVLPVAVVAVLLLNWAILGLVELTSWAAAVTLVLPATAFQVATLRKRTGAAIPAAAVIVAAINVVGVAGYLFFPALSAGAQVSATIPDTAAIYGGAARVFAAASVAAWVGGMLPRPQTSEPTKQASVQDVMTAIPPRLALAAGMIPLLFNVFGYGPSGLLHRNHYLAITGIRMVVSAGSLSTPIAIAILAFVLADPRRPFSTRASAGVLLSAHFVVLFAMGTRQLALIPMLLLLGWTQTRTVRPWARFWTVMAAAMTYLLVQLPLSIRGLPGGDGLEPFLHTLSTNPGIMITFRPVAVVGNVLFGVPLTGDILQLRGGTLGTHAFITSINPLPGALTDWRQVQSQLGVNASTPFNALGELSAYGWGYILGYMAVIAALLTITQRVAARVTPKLATIASLGVLGATTVFSFDLLQYNLRSGLRPIWYVLVLVAIIHRVSTPKAA